MIARLMGIGSSLQSELGHKVDVHEHEQHGGSYANTIGDLTDTTSGLDTLEASFSIRAAAQMRRNADAMYGSALSYSNPDGEHH